MVILIHNKELFISLREVLNFMQDFRNDMENKREECLNDIRNQDLLPELREMSITLTNLDYDMFIESLSKNIIQYQQRIREQTNKKIKSTMIGGK